MQVNRHDLVAFTPRGLALVLENLTPIDAAAPPDFVARLKTLIQGDGHHPPLPGIVRRGVIPMPPELIAVGFSDPHLENGARRRAGGIVDAGGITDIITPSAVFTRAIPPRTPALRAARAVRQAFANDARIGVWGSVALEIFTGMPFTHDQSDLDLILRDCGDADIRAAMASIDAVAAKFNGLRIDVEITLQDGCGINAREYLSDARTLLAKGLHQVRMLDRAAIVNL